MRKPTILVFCDYYLPGYKAGGPPRTIANMVEHLQDDFSFRIVTRDHDLGDPEPYPDCPTNSWTPVGNAQVLYLSPGELRPVKLRRLIRDTRHDVLYLNSYFSWWFGILPLVLRRLGLIHSPIALAPRGELASSALVKSRVRKLVFRALARSAGLYRDVIWHASSPIEQADICRRIGRGVRVMVAPDLPPRFSAPDVLPARRPKRPGALNALFLSRIHRVKNLDGALRYLEGLKGEVSLNIYGPIEDAVYWDECQTLSGRLASNISVRYHGSLPSERVPSVMAEHDVFLLPTRGENFGQVILEALLGGCPVVISDQTPWRNLQSSGAGWDIPLSDTASFRSVLQSLVAMGEVDHNELSRQARLHAQKFQLDRSVIDGSRQLFNEASGQRGR